MKIRFLLLLFLFSFSTALGAREVQLVDRIAAVVNDEVITLSEVDEAALPLYQKYLAGVTDPEEESRRMQKIRKEVLERLIEEKLIAQEIRKYKIKVSDEEVEGFIQEIKTRLGGEEAFRDFLNAQGLTEEEYREQVRQQLQRLKLIRGSVQARIVITDEEVRRYYEEHYLKGTEKTLRLAAIVTSEEARIREAEKALAQGKDFSEVARKYSEIPGSGESFGTFKLSELAPELRRVLAKRRPGEVTPPVASGGRWFIFKVLSIENATKPFEAVKEEIRQNLYQKALDEYFQKWLKGLKERAFIQVFLK
ncbi:hypothetical protein FVE67_06690 [Thermosulfurimonas marina]|uniref:PpiC domain-containing protein n=1 Tax=Thermosulfurimonas marina TaxID=2047767 RepID=A0A6H1WTH4_9BACT|nr:SurA N-terminal domain-containing protein [Thermosulfurimonas marina]QJA06503.1 hypothetical protein FVE67_06690 [Thermosulfurimonas marina]